MENQIAYSNEKKKYPGEIPRVNEISQVFSRIKGTIENCFSSFDDLKEKIAPILRETEDKNEGRPEEKSYETALARDLAGVVYSLENLQEQIISIRNRIEL